MAPPPNRHHTGARQIAVLGNLPFWTNFRPALENAFGKILTLAVVIALFAIPPRCGEYGVVVFFTIVWAAQSFFYFDRLQAATPAPAKSAFVLLIAMTALFGYPIVVGWILRSFHAGGMLAFLGGTVVLIVFVILNRRVTYPSILGREKRQFLAEFNAVRAAGREARIESATRMATLRSQFEERSSGDG